MTEGATRTMPRERLWTFPFLVIVACSLFSFLMGQSSNAGTSVYLERMGSDTSLAGLGALVFSFAAAAGRIASGPAVDALGRAAFMVAGAIVMLIGSFAPMLDPAGTLFVLWRTLQGLGFSICTTACATAAADVLPLERLGEGIGYYGLGQAISMTIGPALAIFLVTSDHPESFYIGLTVFSAAALVCALLCRYERDPSKLPATSEYRMRWEKGDEDERPAIDSQPSDEDQGQARLMRMLVDAVFEPGALRGAIPMMFISVTYGFGIFFIGVFGTSIGAGSPGSFFTVAAVTMIAVRLTSGSFMDKVRPIIIMGIAVGGALVVLAMLCACDAMGDAPAAEWLFYAAGLPYGGSIGVAIPINQTISVRMSPADRWGAANGLFLLANDIAIGISALLCGMAIGSFGFVPTMLGISVCVVVSMMLALILYPKGNV